MRDKIEAHYTELGIEINSHKILRNLLDRIDLKNDLSQQFELFHMDLILQLNSLKSFDVNAFSRYVKNLNSTKIFGDFWGEKFEVYFHSKLIAGVPDYITHLRRGKDGKETDLVFNFNNYELGIELTTLKFTSPPTNGDYVLSKIIDRITDKNANVYANSKRALLVDITNLAFYEKQNRYDISKIFKEKFEGFEYLTNDINFGMIILCQSEFQKSSDNTLRHDLIPRIRLVHENVKTDIYLDQFVNLIFNDFKPTATDYLGFHHLNI